MDFIRPLLMPTLVTLIVMCVWFMGWAKQLEAEATKTMRPTMPSVYASVDEPGDSFQP